MSLLEDIKKLLGSKNEDFNSEGAETPTETPTADADNTDLKTRILIQKEQRLQQRHQQQMLIIRIRIL